MHLETLTSKARGSETGYPAGDAAKSLYDEQDLHRAVEAYRFFYPSVSMEGVFNGGRELGVEDGSGLMLLAARPHHVVLTANSDTPYASGTLDLSTLGPVVVELPPGPYIALVNDHHQGWILDMGIPGPDAGQGGKYVILPPDDDWLPPEGFHIGQSRTYKVLIAIRALPIGGDTAGALNALRKVKVYPFANPWEVLPYVDVTHRALDLSLVRSEDNLEYWRLLHSLIDSEPVLAEFGPMYGELASLGIRKGEPFAPDEHLRGLLETAAKEALDEMRVEAFASTRHDRIVWDDRRWEWIGLIPDNAAFETKGILDLEARDRWFFQAILASPAMFRRKIGGGSVYFLAVRAASGAHLDGGKNYKLSVPQPVPAKLFWSVTAYDARTRSQVRTQQDKAVLGSLQDHFVRNGEDCVDLYFGPEAPPGKEQQWIQTKPGTCFFLYFRIYGPEAASLDGSWKPGDVTDLGVMTLGETWETPTTPTSRVLESLSVPDAVESAFGTLRFEDGVPAEETAAALYDSLDREHAVQAFLNAFQLASTYAIRKGFADIGVNDNDVLLFSGLMDSRSLFLTANCDTLYFIAFLDLSHGPVVLQVPSGVLGVVDDMRFGWVSDVGFPGPDRGEGGKYLFVPNDYTGALPEGGFFVCRSSTHHVLLLGRAFLEKDDPEPVAEHIRQGLEIYSYTPGAFGSSVANFLKGESPFRKESSFATTRFVEGTGLELNTIPPSDASCFEMLHAALELEPAEGLDPEIAGHLAAIGIVKGKPFTPDERLQKILEDAAAIAVAAMRTLSFRPREGEGFHYYDSRSAWMNPLFQGGFEFTNPPPQITEHGVEQSPNPHARLLHARAAFFYLATGVSPAMCMRLTGIGSQYLMAFCDAKGKHFAGSEDYRLTLPPDIPAGAFWSLILYDNQTRSMLQTEQRFPRSGSQSFPTPAARQNGDGSTTIHIGPECPPDVGVGNWIQTVPGKGWFAILRLYSPLEPFFDKTWRPGEFKRV